ncbi:GTP-binding protein Di-Ras1 [Geospiza fortis]|uniref:GTP-binding protein Di-Ras1 n=1 Tax=Geospiza fortis TaxID=48883 RepID=A0A8N5F044_GEOFO|nr:GTP-binding protein Di-Ras1 [Geospiza fortis]
MPEQSNDYRVVVFGAGGVGKSSLVLRFVKGTFRDTYIPTIEDTYRQVISCDKSVCTLQITDTTGSHQFPAMQRLSISKGHAFILVFSVTSKQSLEELKPIYQQIVQIKGSVESIPIMLVGNKCDETQREVESREGEAMAKEWKCAFMETSAKMNYNVKELFQELLGRPLAATPGLSSALELCQPSVTERKEPSASSRGRSSPSRELQTLT